MTPRFVWFLPAVAVLALGACGGSSSPHGAAPPPQPTTASRTPISPTTVARRPSTTVTAKPPPPLPAYVSLVALGVGPQVTVYERPALTAAKQSFPNTWSVDPTRPAAVQQQVFLVESRRANGWVQVLLPVRPNGSSGWVRDDNVAIHAVTYSVKVELHSRQITVFDHGAVLYHGAVAVGKPSTPTPTGRYYVRVLIQAPDPHTIYGPYAYGLSSHSNALSSFDGGDAEIGLHGNDDASVLGTDVTHGCIRMDNAEITKLAALLPLGTPVDIAA